MTVRFLRQEKFATGMLIHPKKYNVLLRDGDTEPHKRIDVHTPGLRQTLRFLIAGDRRTRLWSADAVDVTIKIPEPHQGCLNADCHHRQILFCGTRSVLSMALSLVADSSVRRSVRGAAPELAAG